MFISLFISHFNPLFLCSQNLKSHTLTTYWSICKYRRTLFIRAQDVLGISLLQCTASIIPLTHWEGCNDFIFLKVPIAGRVIRIRLRAAYTPYCFHWKCLLQYSFTYTSLQCCRLGFLASFHTCGRWPKGCQYTKGSGKTQNANFRQHILIANLCCFSMLQYGIFV